VWLAMRVGHNTSGVVLEFPPCDIPPPPFQRQQQRVPSQGTGRDREAPQHRNPVLATIGLGHSRRAPRRDQDTVG